MLFEASVEINFPPLEMEQFLQLELRTQGLAKNETCR